MKIVSVIHFHHLTFPASLGTAKRTVGKKSNNKKTKPNPNQNLSKFIHLNACHSKVMKLNKFCLKLKINVIIPANNMKAINIFSFSQTAN